MSIGKIRPRHSGQQDHPALRKRQIWDGFVRIACPVTARYAPWPSGSRKGSMAVKLAETLSEDRSFSGHAVT